MKNQKTTLTAQEIEARIIFCETELMRCVHCKLPKEVFDIYENEITYYYGLMKENYPKNCI